MAQRKRVPRSSRQKGWNEIGKDIGAKIDKYEKSGDWKQHSEWWCGNHPHHGGGFGRLLFILGVVFALNSIGALVSIPWWATTLVVLGFWWMRL